MASYTTGDRRTYRGPYGGPEAPMSSSSSFSAAESKVTTSRQAQSLKYAKPHELPSHPSVGVEHQAKSSHKAATLAAGVTSDGYRSKGTDTGYAAANTALKHQSAQPKYGVSEEGRQKALLAATMSINRGKAKNTPVGTPPLSSKAIQATRIKRLNMPAAMFTEHPPVAIEKEVEQYQAALHASALSMAKQLYKLEQQKASTPIQPGKPNYPGLKEAAQKLAADRLAKLDPDGLQAYKEHYGYGISLGRSGLGAEDKSQAGKARSQSAQLNARLAGADEDTRQKDRDALMALAEKRVQERLRALDEQVFLDTGKMAPSIGDDWEAQARAKAQEKAEANAEERAEQDRLTTLKVHIGGGKYVDMSEVEKIAAARMQPTLDEITETAQKRRERDEEIRIAEEERRKQVAEEKAEAQKEKDERRMKEYQQKNELRGKMAEEKAERDKNKREEDAERKRVKDEARMLEYQEKNAKRIEDNSTKAERKAIEDEEKAETKRRDAEEREARQVADAERRATLAVEKAERDKIKAEDREKYQRIKAEERADRERMQAEQKAERDAKKELDREARIEKIKEQNARARIKRTESQVVRQAVAEQEEEEGVGPTDIIEETSSSTSESGAALERTASGNIVEDEMTTGGIKASGAGRDVAARVFGAPVDEVAEADKVLMTRAIETEDGGLEMLEENVEVDQDESERLMRDHILSGSNVETEEEPAVETEAEDRLNPTISPSPRRESRRKSFFTKLKSSFGSRTTKTNSSTSKTTAASVPVEGIETAEDDKVGPSIVGASTDGTGEHEAVQHTRSNSEGGLYSEPSDTTERPTHDRAGEDTVSSMYATDDADYDEARARTSTSSAERFIDARENPAESVATTSRDNPFDDAADTHSKFKESL